MSETWEPFQKAVFFREAGSTVQSGGTVTLFILVTARCRRGVLYGTVALALALGSSVQFSSVHLSTSYSAVLIALAFESLIFFGLDRFDQRR
jgi:hypothetical protein